MSIAFIDLAAQQRRIRATSTRPSPGSLTITDCP